MQNKALFSKVVPHDQDFEENYAGIILKNLFFNKENISHQTFVA